MKGTTLQGMDVKKGDLVLMIDYTMNPHHIPNALLFIFDSPDGIFFQARRGIKLLPPANMGDVEIPKYEHVGMKINGRCTFRSNADEVYTGLSDIVEGLSKHHDFACYRRLFESYLRNPDFAESLVPSR